MTRELSTKCLFFIILLCFLFTAVSCNQKVPTDKGRIDTQAAETLLQEFLDFEIDGNAEKVRELEYYDNDWEADLKYNEITSQAQAPIKNYEILSSERVNDSIIAFHINAISVYDNSPMTFYNFVIFLNGEYRIACNIRNIPDELSDGKDLSIYSNATSASVSVEDVLIASEK